MRDEQDTRTNVGRMCWISEPYVEMMRGIGHKRENLFVLVEMRISILQKECLNTDFTRAREGLIEIRLTGL